MCVIGNKQYHCVYSEFLFFGHNSFSKNIRSGLTSLADLLNISISTCIVILAQGNVAD